MQISLFCWTDQLQCKGQDERLSVLCLLGLKYSSPPLYVGDKFQDPPVDAWNHE